MKIRSSLSHKEYLSAMKSHMESYTDFGVQRFTGLFIGRFFSVTHHSGFEWNRRFTNEKQRVIGFVKKDAEGCTVHCVRLAGYTNPLSLIGFTLLYFLIFSLQDGGFHLLIGKHWWMPLVGALITAVISAAGSCLTERGEEGSRMINALILDPVDPYSVMRY